MRPSTDASPGPAAGRGTGIDVWTADLAPAIDATRPLMRILDDFETARADRFIDADGTARYVATHAALRSVLAGYLGCDAAAVPLVNRPCPHCGRPHGKPAVERTHGGPPPVDFSYASSRDHAAIAVATVEVGIDIECTSAGADLLAAAATWLADDELRGLATTTDARREATCHWTRKEAFLKGVGRAFDQAPVEVAVVPDDGGWHAVDETGVAWCVQDLDLDLDVAPDHAPGVDPGPRPGPTTVPTLVGAVAVPDAPSPPRITYRAVDVAALTEVDH
jgi:4'-phosphopantetheinyl transferase